MFRHVCPECGVELAFCPNDLIADEVFLCEECDTRWVVCPDCGNLTDADENWDHEQGVCDECAITDGDDDIHIFTLSRENSIGEVHEFLEKLFGEE